MNNITSSKQQLILEFNEAQQGFIDSLNNGMGYAFRMGEILTKIKKITPHGQFETVVKSELKFAFGMRQAQKLMRIYEHKSEVLSLSNGEPLTIDSAAALIARAKEAPGKTNKESEPKAMDGEDAILDKVMLNDTLDNGVEEIIEGEYEEVRCTPDKPETDHKPNSTEPVDDEQEEYTELDHLRDHNADLQEEIKRLSVENEQMRIVFEDDNHVAAAIREIDRLKSLNDALENRLQGHLNSYQNERHELIRTLNHWKRRAEKAEKALEVANAK